MAKKEHSSRTVAFLRLFYFITLAVMVLGVVYNVSVGKADIFQIWFLIALLVGVYLLDW